MKPTGVRIKKILREVVGLNYVSNQLCGGGELIYNIYIFKTNKYIITNTRMSKSYISLILEIKDKTCSTHKRPLYVKNKEILQNKKNKKLKSGYSGHSLLLFFKKFS